MRFPVFAARRNPATDRAIVRKSRSHVQAQVDAGRADWIDPADHSKGIVIRELTYFGPRTVSEPSAPVLAGAELPGLHFEEPETADLIHRIQLRFLPHAQRATVLAIERREART